MIVIKKKSLVFASIYILGGYHKLYLIFDEPNVLSYLPNVVLTLPNINIFNLDQEHWTIFGSVKNLFKKISMLTEKILFWQLKHKLLGNFYEHNSWQQHCALQQQESSVPYVQGQQHWKNKKQNIDSPCCTKLLNGYQVAHGINQCCSTWRIHTTRQWNQKSTLSASP